MSLIFNSLNFVSHKNRYICMLHTCAIHLYKYTHMYISHAYIYISRLGSQNGIEIFVSHSESFFEKLL